MTAEIANIFITEDKAFLPVLGKTEHNLFWEIGPVFTAELNVDSLASALEEIIKAGNPAMPHPTQDEFRKITPVQKAIGIHSWKKMAQMGIIGCVVYWVDDITNVAFSPLEASDIQLVDYENQVEFPPDTSLREISKFILDEVELRRSPQEDIP